MKSYKKLISLTLVIALTSAIATGCLAPAPEAPAEETAAATVAAEINPDAKVIRVSNGVSEDHPSITALREVFAPMVAEGTEGRYVIEVYHSNQLGDDTKSTEAVRSGTIEMNCTSTAPMVGFCPELAIFDIPYMFESYEQADAILEGPIGDLLTEKLAEHGLINLAWGENGFRDLTTREIPVKTPADLEGQKIRTMDNKYHLKTWELLGANPTPMSWAEVFTALQQGAIDGQENPVPNFYTAQIQEVAPNITTTEHVYAPFALQMSEKVWVTISPEDQKVFKDAAEKAMEYERKLNREKEQEYLTLLEQDGKNVIRLTPEEKAVFAELTLPVWDMVAADVGQELIDQLNAELERTSTK